MIQLRFVVGIVRGGHSRLLRRRGGGGNTSAADEGGQQQDSVDADRDRQPDAKGVRKLRGQTRPMSRHQVVFEPRRRLTARLARANLAA